MSEHSFYNFLLFSNELQEHLRRCQRQPKNIILEVVWDSTANQ
jgi:hypothetical protein